MKMSKWRVLLTAFSASLTYAVNNEGFLWDPPRVPTYYNFSWVPHTFGGLIHPDPPPYFAHWLDRYMDR